MKNNKTLTRFLMVLSLSMLAITFANAQKTVSGKVTGDDGQGVPSVTVVVKGTSNGTATDNSGSYSITVPDDKAVLVFSSIGFSPREVKVGSAATIDLKLAGNDEIMNTLFVTATSRPVRKIETITAVDVIGAKELARAQPINIADALRFSPGVFVTTGSGRTRNGIFVRGFPDLGSNGLIYTSLLFDGLRTFASPEMVPDAAFRMDMNVERIEFVRGSAATLYGRGAAAGAINVISKIGGEKLAGGARVTVMQNNGQQYDLNLNGKITQALRFNVGGFYLQDAGLRDNPFPDKGFQFRGNLDYFLPNNKGSIRLSAGAIDLAIQNQIDLPYATGDLSKPATGYTTRDVILNKDAFDKAFNKDISLTYPDGTVETFNIADKMKRGNFSKGFNIGLNFDINLGSGFSLINKGRYQDMTVGTQFDFPLTTTYGSTQNRVLFVGNGKGDGGSHAKDLINELRIQKTIDNEYASHTLTAGYYYSNIDVRAAAIGHWYNISTINAANRASSIQGATGFFGPNPTFATTLFRNGNYNENVNSFFAGDEIRVEDKLTINVGFRADQIGLDLSEDRFTTPIQRDAKRAVTHKGLSASMGVNIALSKTSALYANYVRAYRAPDYSAYTTVIYSKYTRDTAGRITGLANLAATDNALQQDANGRTLYANGYIDKNEIINSIEAGYRATGDDISFDGGLFYNTISDRLVSTFIGATAVQIPGGDNLIAGAEVSLYYAPQALKGFYGRASVTLQTTKYQKLVQNVSATNFISVAGNKVAGVPTGIYNFSVGYERGGIGLNLNSNTLAGRPVDPFNTINYPITTVADVNASYKLTLKNKSSAKVKVSVTNLFDTQAAGNVVSGATDNFYRLAKDNNYTASFAHVRGVPQLPRRMWVTLEYLF